MCATGECHNCSVLADLELEMEPSAAGEAEAAEIASASRREAAETIHALMTDVSAGLRVLRTRDGVPLTDEQIRERAANVVCSLIGNYRIEPLVGVTYSRPVPTEQDFMDERIK